MAVRALNLYVFAAHARRAEEVQLAGQFAEQGVRLRLAVPLGCATTLGRQVLKSDTKLTGTSRLQSPCFQNSNPVIHIRFLKILLTLLLRERSALLPGQVIPKS